MIILLTCDVSGAVPFPEVNNLTLSALDGLVTMGGCSLAGRFPALTLDLVDGCDVPRGLVDYFTVGLIGVVSSELKLVLESAGAELEYFPVTVLYQNLPTPLQYFSANPLTLIWGADLTNSEVELDDELGDCVEVRKLVLDESKFDGIKIAAIAEIPYLGVQAELARAIESSGCIGCAFIDPMAVRY